MTLKTFAIIVAGVLLGTLTYVGVVMLTYIGFAAEEAIALQANSSPDTSMALARWIGRASGIFAGVLIFWIVTKQALHNVVQKLKIDNRTHSSR